MHLKRRNVSTALNFHGLIQTFETKEDFSSEFWLDSSMY